MPLRNGVALDWKAMGLSDTVDGTDAFAGAMSSLANLIPALHTKNIFVPRPACTQLTAFGTFTTPAQGECLLAVGTRYYGLIASGRFAGHSEPFCFDTTNNAFVSISGVTSGNTPTSTSTSGAWTPPTAAQVGSRVVFTHPGFAGGVVGWLDMSGLSDTSVTGTTHGTTTIDTLSKNVLQAGWRPGMTITDADANIPANTRIVSIASNGLSIVISNVCTGSNAGDGLTVAGGTTAAPLWFSGAPNGQAIAGHVVAVSQFTGRAYYAATNAVVMSDVGDPLQITNTNGVQVITFQNGLNVTALKGFPVTQTQGGILQALVVFQGAGAIQQISGDPATNNLTVNEIIEGVGTLAPLTIAQIPLMGMAFIAPDGLRVIDFFGRCSEPIGANGDGVSLPLSNATNPSRMTAAYNTDVYRVTVTGNIAVGGQVLSATQSVEYWYHSKQKTWSGPHSFPARLIVASQTDSTFVMFALTSGAIGLWTSQVLPNNNSTYTENGTQLQWTWQTCLLPDNKSMSMNAIVETTITIALGAGDAATCQFSDDTGAVLDVETLTSPNSLSLWGSMTWGSNVWGGPSAVLHQRQIPWAQPLVFKQGSLQFNGGSDTFTQIGNAYMRYQELGYLIEAVT